jgi:epsilon-lactone hydrolase
MDKIEIEGIRAMLRSKPRPVGWEARRGRLDEVGSVWPVAGDVEVAGVDLGGRDG